MLFFPSTPGGGRIKDDVDDCCRDDRMEVIGRETEGSKDTKRYVKLGQEERILATWPNMPRLLFRVTPSIFMEKY